MQEHHGFHFRCFFDCRQAYVKSVASLFLIAWGVLHSTLGVAEQKNSPFQNIINKVSRSGTLLMLQAVCDAGKAEIRDGVARCTACPSFTSTPAEKSGFELAHLVLGSFTVAREPEALLHMKGCESAATVNGGITLLERTASGWSRLQYHKGFGFTECLKFRTQDDVSNLLCNHSSIVDGNQTGRIFWLDLAENKLSTTPLVRWYDNSTMNPRELVSVFPHRFLRSDFNQDGRSDVRISFRVREQFIPEKYSGALEAINSGYAIDPPRALHLTYLFNGVSLKLEKDSQKDLTILKQILNKHLPTTNP